MVNPHVVIQVITPDAYRSEFGIYNLHPIDYVIINHEIRSIKLISAYYDDIPIGILCAYKDQSDQCLQLGYVYIKESFRRIGIASELLTALFEIAKRDYIKSIRADILENGYLEIRTMLMKYEFKLNDTMKTFVYSVTKQNIALWEEFFHIKGTRMIQTLSRWGYQAIPFSQVNTDHKLQILNFYANGFSTEPDPVSIIIGKNEQFMKDASFIAVQDNKIKAYTLLTRIDSTSCTFEQYSVSNDCQGTGVILVPFAASMNYLIHNGIGKIVCTIREENEGSLRLLKELLSPMNPSCFRRSRFEKMM